MEKAILAIKFRIAMLKPVLSVAGIPESILSDTEARIDELEALLRYLTK